MAWVASLSASPSSLHWFTSHWNQTNSLPVSGFVLRGSVTPIFVGSFLFSSVAAFAASTPLAALPPEPAVVVSAPAAVVSAPAAVVAAPPDVVSDEELPELPQAASRLSTAVIPATPCHL